MNINIHVCIYKINIVFTPIIPLCVVIMFFCSSFYKRCYKFILSWKYFNNNTWLYKGYISGCIIRWWPHSKITGNSRLVYAQTAIAHKEYFNYVYSFFIPFCAKDYIPQSRLIRDNITKKYIVLYLSQLCNFSVLMNLEKCFNEFREMF